MFANPLIPAKALYPFCYAMARMLEAGVDVRKSLPTAVKTSRSRLLQQKVRHVSELVQSGYDLTSAFRQHEDNFPDLFLDLLRVGEETGSLPEIMNALGQYYEARVTRVREFRSAIAWPLIQLFAAILIIGLLIYVLGLIGSRPGVEPIDILGLGLMGTPGAIKWFCLTYGGLAALWFGWKLGTRSLAGQKALDPFLLMIPAVGGCLKKFAIARFAWCFSLTQGAGMSIRPSLTSSLNATANGAYMAADGQIWMDIRGGEELGTAFRNSQLFPEEFLHFVEVAEQTGTVPEAMQRMSHQFDEEAHRALQWLTVIAARAVWAVVAMAIIFFIFRIAMFYLNVINSGLEGLN